METHLPKEFDNLISIISICVSFEPIKLLAFCSTVAVDKLEAKIFTTNIFLLPDLLLTTPAFYKISDANYGPG